MTLPRVSPVTSQASGRGLDLDILRDSRRAGGGPRRVLGRSKLAGGRFIEVKSIDEPAVSACSEPVRAGDFVAAASVSGIPDVVGPPGKTLESRSEFIPCDTHTGMTGSWRPRPLGKEEKQVLPREMPNRKPRTESGTGAMKRAPMSWPPRR